MLHFLKSCFETYIQGFVDFFHPNIFSFTFLIVMSVAVFSLTPASFIQTLFYSLKSFKMIFKKNLYVPDASDGRVSRQHRRSEENGGRAD